MKGGIVLLNLLLLLLLACGTSTKAKPYAELSKDEQARKALDELDYETAVEIFKELVEAEPEEYERYRLLAAAYAALGGFDIIEAAKSNIGGSASGSLLDSLSAFLPADPSAVQLESMRLAKETLLAMPPEYRSRTNSEVSYASGAAIQLEFYQSAYSIMLLNQFTEVGVDGKLDPSKLNSMTDADVDAILSNFASVAATGTEGVPAAAQAVLAQVDQQEGASQREKLINYMNKSKT